MTNYYQEIITQKSWRLLQQLKKRYDFVLIGDWAVWLYTKALKSKDIDLVIDYETLGVWKEKFAVFKNERLKKYEARVEEVEVDIYLPHYSNPGLPPEFVLHHVLTKEGFKVPKAEILLILKQDVFARRKTSVKGEKDRLDIFSLLALKDLNFAFYKKILKETKKEEFKQKLAELLKTTVRVKELGLTNHKIAKLRKQIILTFSKTP